MSTFSEEARLSSPTNDPKDAPVWITKIPVIASFGNNSQGCAGMKQADESFVESDPQIDLTLQYRIIGFVDLVVYDLDIGNPPPMYPYRRPLNSPNSDEPCDWKNEYCDLCSTELHWGGRPDIAQGMTPSIEGPFSSPLVANQFGQLQQWYPEIYPYGFTLNNQPNFMNYPYFAIDTDPQNCNLVRARVKCGTESIASPSASISGKKTYAVLSK